MNRGTVVGEVWATRQAPSLNGRKLLLVDVADAAGGTGEIVVAIDTLDAGIGEQVLIAYGSGARRVLAAGPDAARVLADAAVAEIIDRQSPPLEE
jgi:ethanolamine utilization protein EutN